MSNEPNKVVSNLALSGFAISVVLLILFSFPSNFELGTYHALSYQMNKAEKLLKNTKVGMFTSNARHLRGLVDVLEAQGKTKGAVALLERLVRIRPRNADYWFRLSQLYSWDGRQYKALQAFEKSQRYKNRNISLADLTDLAKQYEWIYAIEDAKRIHREIITAGNASTADYNNAARIFFLTQSYDEYESLFENSIQEKHGGIKTGRMLASIVEAQTAKDKKGSTKKLQKSKQRANEKAIRLSLISAFRQAGKFEKAAYHAYISLNGRKKFAENFWQNPDLLEQITNVDHKKDRPIIEELHYIFSAAKREKERAVIYELVRRFNLLSKSDHFEYIDLLTSQRRHSEALQEISMYRKQHSLNRKETLDLSKRYMWNNSPALAEELLLELISNRNLSTLPAKGQADRLNSPAPNSKTESRKKETTPLKQPDLKSGAETDQPKTSDSEQGSKNVKAKEKDIEKKDRANEIKNEASKLDEHKDKLEENKKTIQKLNNSFYQIVDSERLIASTSQVLDIPGLHFDLSEDILYLAQLETDSPSEESADFVDQKAIYMQLLEAYDAQSKHEKSIELMHKMIASGNSKEIAMSEAENIAWREKIAEREAWSSNPKAAVAILKGIHHSKLSTKGKAIRIVNLYFVQRAQAAYQLLKKFTRPEFDSIPKPIQNQIIAMIREYRKAKKAERQRIAEQRRLALEERAKVVEKKVEESESVDSDSFLYSPLDIIALEKQHKFISSHRLIRAARINTYHFQLEYSQKNLEKNAFSKELKADLGVLPKQSVVFLQGGYAHDVLGKNLNWSAGWNIGGNYFGPRFKAELSGSFLGADYASASVDLAKPILFGDVYIDQGISEANISLYDERKLHKDVTSSSEFLLKIPHAGKEFAAGLGVDLSTRIKITPFEDPGFIGPWIFLARFSSSNSILKNLYSKQTSILGAVLGRDVWNHKRTGWKAHVTGGVGQDISAEIGGFTGFVESYVEKAWSSQFGIRLEYNSYYGDLKNTNTSASHNVRLQFLLAF